MFLFFFLHAHVYPCKNTDAWCLPRTACCVFLRQTLHASLQDLRCVRTDLPRGRRGPTAPSAFYWLALCCTAELSLLPLSWEVLTECAFCGFEWDRVLSCVWEAQWADRKAVHLTSGVCENLKELQTDILCIWLWTAAFEAKLSLQC